MHPQQFVTESIYQQLLQLRNELSAFQTVSCRLMHEQVQHFIDESIPDDADVEQLRVKRKGFCNAGMRRNWLGCAHTTANDTFVRLADSIYNTCILKMATHPSNTINDLIMKIYLADHEKGEMEKRKAFAQHQQRPEEVISIQCALQEIVARHQAAIDVLEQLRSEIMGQLNKAIENYQSATQPV